MQAVLIGGAHDGHRFSVEADLLPPMVNMGADTYRFEAIAEDGTYRYLWQTPEV